MTPACTLLVDVINEWLPNPMSTRPFLSKFGQLETFGTISEVEANLMDLDDIKILRSRDFLKMYCELQNWGLRQQ